MEKRKKIFSWNKYLIQVSCCLAAEKYRDKMFLLSPLKKPKKLR